MTMAISTDATDASTQHYLPVIADTIRSRPIALEHQSRLMQLPAEIRVMILRNLLVNGFPLKKRQRYEEQGLTPDWKPGLRDTKGRFIGKPVRRLVDGYLLSPAVLSTCQDLFREGWPILYGENTLVLSIHAGQPVHRYSAETLCPVPSCHNCIYVCALLEGDQTVSQNSPPGLKASAQSFIARFSKMRIVMCISNNDTAYYQLRTYLIMLQHIVSQVQLQVQFLNEPSLSTAGRLEHHIKSLQLLRTRQLEVLGCHNARSVAEAVTATVTSTEPVLDLSKLLENLQPVKSMLETSLYMRNDVQGATWSYEVYQDLKETIKDWDIQKFNRLKAEMVAKFEEEVEMRRRTAY